MGRASITVSCRCRGVGVDIIAGPAGWSGSDGAARLAPVPAAHGGLLPRVAVRGRARLAPVPAAHGGLLPRVAVRGRARLAPVPAAHGGLLPRVAVRGRARLAPVPAAHGGLLPRVAVRGRARLAPVPAAHGGLLPSLRRVIGKRKVTWSADAVAYSDKTSPCWRYLSTGVCRLIQQTS